MLSNFHGRSVTHNLSNLLRVNVMIDEFFIGNVMLYVAQEETLQLVGGLFLLLYSEKS